LEIICRGAAGRETCIGVAVGVLYPECIVTQPSLVCSCGASNDIGADEGPAHLQAVQKCAEGPPMTMQARVASAVRHPGAVDTDFSTILNVRAAGLFATRPAMLYEALQIGRGSGAAVSA